MRSTHKAAREDGRAKKEARDPISRDAVDPVGTLTAFRLSPELARLQPCDRELVWVEELLDMMDCSGWSWNELDRDGLAAALFVSMKWSIKHPPREPHRVARVLGAFLSFAGRQYGAPHWVECCEYLASRRARVEMRKWVASIAELPTWR
jgi:hypothetical protein